jgi:hypothetical protein
MYYAVTLAPGGCSVPISSAHFFDLDTRRVTAVAPLPIESLA